MTVILVKLYSRKIKVSTFRPLRRHAIDSDVVARIIQWILSQLRIQFKRKECLFQKNGNLFT